MSVVPNRDSRYAPGRTRPFDFRRASHRRIRAAVFTRDAFTCRSCGFRPDAVPDDYDGRFTVGGLHLDHVLPRCAGGSRALDNLQVLCASCNSSKSGTL